MLALIAIAVHSVVVVVQLVVQHCVQLVVQHSVCNVVVQHEIVAQVYTRDATHRPTATLTPSRGAFVTLLGVSGVFEGV